MDHFVLTLILGAIEVLIVPWVAWATVKLFEITAKVLVLESNLNQEVSRQKDQNKSLKESIEKLDRELMETRKEIADGFKEIISAINEKQ